MKKLIKIDIDYLENSKPIELQRDKRSKWYIKHYSESKHDEIMKHSNRDSFDTVEEELNSDDEKSFMDFYLNR